MANSGLTFQLSPGSWFDAMVKSTWWNIIALEETNFQKEENEDDESNEKEVGNAKRDPE